MKNRCRTSSFFIARFSVMVAGAAARDQAATLDGLLSHPSFRLGEVPNQFHPISSMS